jgi:DNA modification methylase
MSNYKINHADIKEWARDYDGEPFDAILCDPPYELGFMGKSWDSSGIAFDTEMWADLLRILKPGGHLLAFSGSRTYHRMAVAIEDAGFEIRDMIEWIYGSGFPKSLNIGKAVDKIQGNEREELDERGGAIQKGSTNWQGQDRKDGKGSGFKERFTDTKGTSPYEGYGTALKPAHEPCVLARKPIEGTVANNALKYGTGGLNIDGSRVGTPVDTRRPVGKSLIGTFQLASETPGRDDVGRFPANLIHDGSDEVVGLFPYSKSPKTYTRASDVVDSNINWNPKKSGTEQIGIGDSGSAARFFYTAKASKSERNAGLEGTNFHCTVKPLALTKYLANLIKPPTGGRLLVPFSGSGSEMIGALQAGWEYVEGVELTEEYIPIAEARIEYWTRKEKVVQGALL